MSEVTSDSLNILFTAMFTTGHIRNIFNPFGLNFYGKICLHFSTDMA